MKCIGCSTTLKTPAAYAIMGEDTLAKLKAKPDVKGPGKFHAAACCQACFVDPKHRKRTLKAHFALPADVKRLVFHAGSSTGIGMGG